MDAVATRKFAKGLLTVALLVTSGCPGGEEPTTPPPSSTQPVSQVVTVAGGTLTLSNGASLQFPPEALDSDVQVTMAVSAEAPPAELQPASPLFHFEPSGTVFARPVKVSIPITGNVSNPTLYWSTADGSGYEAIGGEVRDGFLVAEVLHFSGGFVAPSQGTRTVGGVNNETRVIETGVMNVPRDYSRETVSALVPGADGKFTEYVGTGRSDGTFSIPNVPVGTFYLKTGSTYLVTNQSVLDLGASRPGRPDSVRPSQPTPLTFNVSNLHPWQQGDHLQFFSTRSNTWFFDIENYAANPPAVGDTSISGMKLTTGPGGSYYGIAHLVEAAKGDRAIFAQLTRRTSNTGVPYTAMSRVAQLAPFTQVDGQEQVVTGELVEVSTAKSIALHVKSRQYNAYKGPSVSSSDFIISVQGLPGGNERGMYSSSADFLLLEPSLEADLQTGTMTYGTPLDGTWGVSVLTRASFQSQYRLPGATGNAASLYGSVSTIDPVDDAPGAMSLSPRLSPVQNPKLNGTSLFTEASGVDTSPVVSWEPPALGTPSLYLVSVSRLYIDGNGNTRSTQVGSVYTRDTQVRMPVDLMLAGRAYVLSISARQNAVSTPKEPYRDTLPSAAATVTSAIIQMAPAP